MRAWKGFVLGLLAAVAAGAIFGAILVRRGFQATSQPSRIETVVARAARNLSISTEARTATNPVEATPENLQ
ncbi:MAG: hypothetical protein ACRD3J_28810, partial [Thermoanaerobaculia bacterium]